MPWSIRGPRACVYKVSRCLCRVGEPETIIHEETGLKKVCWVGIDVSAKELVVITDREGKRSSVLLFSNDASGHQKLAKHITQRGGHARVVIESTGVYGLDLAMALDQAKRVEIMVANPRAIHRFGGACLQRSKTDALDAEIILEFAMRMPFKPWLPPAPEVLELRDISRRIESLTKTSSQEKNRLHASSQSDQLSSIVRNDIKDSIEHLEMRIHRLRTQAIEIITLHPSLAKAFGHITSIKGIADAAGIQILAELAILPPDMNVRQWVAHAGLDPRQHQSGTSVYKPARISKTGNTHLRRALFMPALVAVRWEPNVRAFYDKLLDRKKTKMQANIAVMRKLLHAIHGMLKHDKDFEGEKFYALSA